MSKKRKILVLCVLTLVTIGIGASITIPIFAQKMIRQAVGVDEFDSSDGMTEAELIPSPLVDAYGNQQEKERMDDWNLTALTYKSKDEWKKFFYEAGYTGDYYWFIP